MTRVLIAGGGPTGLVLACDLLRRGADMRIIEKAQQPPTGSRGEGLQPRSLEVFDDLGVLDAVLAESTDYPTIRRYANGNLVWEGRMHEPQEPTESVPYPNIQMIAQPRVEHVLRERLGQLGGRVEQGVELVGFAQDEDGVTATLSTGERLTVDYLVGADGGRSFVRKHLGVGFEGETYETERMIVGDVRADGLGRDYWHTWAHASKEGKWLAMCPLPGGDIFQIVFPVDADEEPELTVDAMQRVVDEATGGTGIRLRDAPWLSLYRPNIRMVDRFRVGRVFLAGDAAHVHSPAGGQGLNTGIQDAYNLGWKLAAVLAGAPAELLDTYEEERLPVAAEVLGISTRLHNTRSQTRGKETHQLGITYRGTTLAGEPSDRDLQAGDRAPDALCGNETRLFDLFRGPHFTLLAFGAELGFRSDQVHAHAVDCDYGVERGSYVLVRPDGYIGLITKDASRVADYLARVSATTAVAG
jgi:2-polyprenyl-6-methoxyphenol hydroxylase-like FAD-dependent oxidoreductase